MKRRRHTSVFVSNTDAANTGMFQNQNTGDRATSFQKGKRPNARDGHSANVDKFGFMFVFGGDRHQMPFNDLYIIKLPK